MHARTHAGCLFVQLSALQAEHQASAFYPKPAAPGSQLHHKLLAGAAGAIMHGQFAEAQALLAAAGEWETSMALAVCAGDFAALRSLAAGLQVRVVARAVCMHMRALQQRRASRSGAHRRCRMTSS